MIKRKKGQSYDGIIESRAVLWCCWLSMLLLLAEYAIAWLAPAATLPLGRWPVRCLSAKNSKNVNIYFNFNFLLFYIK
jgi:hypothetical protein